MSLLTLKTANGLDISYVGYAILDFEVAGIRLQERGVIVKDEFSTNYWNECYLIMLECPFPGPISVFTVSEPCRTASMATGHGNMSTHCGSYLI